MLVTFDVPAPGGERFAPDCLASQVGRETTFSAPCMPEIPATSGVLAKAFVGPGGHSAELTADIPDDSEMACAVIRAAGGYAGRVKVHEDGHVSRLVEIRRRDPAEAARLMREGSRERGIPQDLAEAMIAGMLES
jgi:hypothetical protein